MAGATAGAGILAALLVVPIVCLRPIASIDIVGPVRLALEFTIGWVGTRLGLDGVPARPNWLPVPQSVIRRLPTILLGGYGFVVLLGLIRLVLAAG